MENVSIKTFEEYLVSELSERTKKNPSYSLRSFASKCDVSPAYLSQVLNGRRSLSSRSIQKIGKALELSEEKIKSYLILHQLKKAGFSGQENSQYISIEESQREFLSDWDYLALLELTHCKSFQSDEKWVAKTLGISTYRVREIKTCLTKIGLLHVDENGNWIDKMMHLDFCDQPTMKLPRKKLQKKLLELALSKIEDVSEDKRDNSSITMAIDISKLNEAKKIIKKFRRDLCDLLESGESKNEVYNLSVALFPVSRITESFEEKR